MKKIFILFGIVLLLLLNIPYLYSFYKNLKGENFYNNKNYDKALKTFTENKVGYYNKGNTLYKIGKYDEAIKTYFSILTTGNSELNFRLNHNLGNSYYRYGEKQKNNKEKRFYWGKAVSYYKNALKIKFDKETKDNLEFVLKKLNDLNKSNKDNKNNQDKQKKDGKNQDKKQQDNKGNKGEKSDNKNGNQKQQEKGNEGKKSDNKSKNNGQNNKGSKKGENKKDDEAKKQLEEQKQLEAAKKAGLNEEEYKALKEYQKELNKEQKNNMNFYGKVYQENKDPFFDDMFNQGSNVRDW